MLSFGGEKTGRLTRYQDLTAPRSGVETRFAMRCSHYLICRTGHLSMICVLKPVVEPQLEDGKMMLGVVSSSILPPGACHPPWQFLIGIISMEAGVKLMYK